MNTTDEQLRTILDSYKTVRLSSGDLSLSPAVKRALPQIREAMDRIHEIFLAQQDEERIADILKKQSRRDTLGEFYRRFQGPWYPVEDFKSYDPEIPDRAPGCSFYPPDMTEGEFTAELGSREKEEREAFEGPTTVIRRDEEGGLYGVPYHRIYAEKLAEVFDALDEAAGLLEDEIAVGGEGDGVPKPAGSSAGSTIGSTAGSSAGSTNGSTVGSSAGRADDFPSREDNSGLKRVAEYLRVRAEALVTGNYREADGEWVRLKDVPLELVLGPYEVYADALLGRKAMYEGMLMVVDQERCDRLREIETHLGELSAAFPMPAGSKPAVGGLAPMVVVHQIYNAGESRQPIYPAAFNLPNDPWVRGNVGWKQVMIYNVMRAKFSTATVSIARRILKGGADVEFEPFFYEVILHEVSHGLGPAYRSDGRSVDGCLGPHYTAIEEAKADTGGLFFLLEKGGTRGIPDFKADQILRGYVAAQFRAMRFGIKEAHGAANVIQHNWMIECGGIERTSDGYVVHPEEARRGIRSLLEELCRIQAEASLSEAAAFLDRWARPDEELKNTLESLNDVPIDLFIEFD